MDIFVRLLQGDSETAGPTAALDALEAAVARAASDPTAAREGLRRAGRRHEALFSLGGDLHGLYRAAYEALHARVALPSSTVHLVSSSALGPTCSLRGLQRVVRRVAARLLLVRADASGGVVGAAAELDALALLGADDAAAAAVLAARDVLLQRELLLDLVASDRPMAPQDLTRALTLAIRAAGLPVLAVAS